MTTFQKARLENKVASMRADIDTLIQKSDMTQILRDDLVIKEELARRQNTIDALTRENAQLKNALRAANEEIRKNVDVVKNMKKKLREEEEKRRKLHDAIQCLKDNYNETGHEHGVEDEDYDNNGSPTWVPLTRTTVVKSSPDMEKQMKCSLNKLAVSQSATGPAKMTTTTVQKTETKSPFSRMTTTKTTTTTLKPETLVRKAKNAKPQQNGVAVVEEITIVTSTIKKEPPASEG